MAFNIGAFRFGSKTVDNLRAKTPTGLTSLAGTPTSKPPGMNGPTQLMNPYDKSAASSYASQHLTVNAPKPVGPTDPNHLYAGNPPATTAPKPVSSPTAVVNQLRAPAAPTPASTSVPISAGFTSTDPNIQARIQAMQNQAAPTAPPPSAPPPTSPRPNIQMAGSNTGGYTAPADIQKYREGVLAALRPSDRESQLADELAQFRGDAAQGIAGLEGQGRGIPLGIVRGQQEQLQRQANLQEQTLMERLAAASADRQAALQAAQTQLGFAQTDLEKQQAEQALQQAQLKPFELNGSLVALNPTTGQYEAVYTSPTGGGEGFTLSAGQQRFDAQGNPIASVAPNETDKQPATVQEYEFARQQGFQGSFLDYQQAKSAAGTAPKAPTAEQSKAAGFADRVAQSSQVINSLESQFTGLTSQLPFVPEYLRSEDRKLLEQAESNFINAVLRRESGAAISQGEFESARKQYFPQPGDTAAVLQQKKQNRDTVFQNLQTEAAGTPYSQSHDPLGLGFSSAPSTAVKGSIVNVNIGQKPVQVSSELAPKLAAADAEFFQATGQHLEINEALRSSERQAELYNKYQSGQGGRAAPPGKSFHEKGLAVDIGNWQQAEPYLRKYGLKNDLADDRNHFSLREFA